MPKLASNLLSEGVQHCGLEVRRSWCTCWRHAGSARYVCASAGTLGDGAQHRCDRSTSARLADLQLVHGGNAIKVASKYLKPDGFYHGIQMAYATCLRMWRVSAVTNRALVW